MGSLKGGGPDSVIATWLAQMLQLEGVLPINKRVLRGGPPLDNCNNHFRDIVASSLHCGSSSDREKGVLLL